MPKPVKGNGRYMAGIDGLRALAVLAVIAYHLNLAWTPGGLLGVGVFFVLSGYLITDILVGQWKRNKRIDFKDFWMRRARRLLPAMFIMLVVVVAWVALFDRAQIVSLREDALAAILYVSNWWFIFHKVSYFASFGPPSPLGHLWSLAVEEQFYLIWPLVLAFGLRFAPRRGQLIGITLAGATASALAMAMIYQPGADPSRVYYGTDTRAFSLLIGAALALVWPSRQLSATISYWSRLFLDLLGSIGLLSIFFMIWSFNEYNTFLYRGGMVLLSIAAAVVVATLAHPASGLSKVLGCKPLRWLGVRSYGIYLWHYPVIVLTSPTVDTGGFDVTRAVFQVAASIALAALSWRFVEEPIRHGALGKLWTQLRISMSRKGPVTNGLWITSVSALLVLSVFCVGMAVKTPAATSGSGSQDRSITLTTTVTTDHKGSRATTPNENSNGKHISGKQGTSTVKTSPGTDTSQNSPTAGTGNATGTGSTSGTGNTTGTGSTSGVPVKSGQGVTAIGDSVMIDAAPYLEKLLPGIVVDGEVGRQMSQAPAVINQLRSEGKLGDRIIIELGTNGDFTKDQLTALLQSLGSVKQIVLVNTRVPRPWQDVVNSTLAEVAASFPHTTLVNWYNASAGKNSLFYSDGVHLQPDGAQFYASLLAKAIN
jgi:peptidoglycan/LPS O-acetylase OafA/YrhL